MCFGLEWIKELLIWLVIVCAVVAILRLFLPWILGQLGIAGGMIMAVINIFIWAVILIFVIYFVFALMECLLSGGGGLPLFPHAR